MADPNDEWELTRVCAVRALMLGDAAFRDGLPIQDVPRFGKELVQGYLASYWMRGWLRAQDEEIQRSGGVPTLRLLGSETREDNPA